ncbi:MAG: 5,6-dimethylbenzimidazole synthase [Aestuariivirgaceae bacterium]
MTSRPPEFSSEFRQTFADLIRWRRDVRRFRPDPVDSALIDQCLELASQAPSVGLSQPWRFVELIDRQRRERVIASFERSNEAALASYDGDTATQYARLKLEGLREAPVQIAVFADETTAKGKRLGRRTMPEMLHYSVVTAVHTFWLAARAHGLGVGWVSILQPDEVAAACDAMPEWSLIAYLCVGWPVEQTDRPELERAGWETRGSLNGCFRRL